MLFHNFHGYLKKLNRNLWVDCNHQLKTYHPDFPFAGLYKGREYLFAVPHNVVPEWSIVESASGRMLARGYRAILSMLVERGIVNRKKAESLFQCELEPGRQNFPKHEISLENYKDIAAEEAA